MGWRGEVATREVGNMGERGFHSLPWHGKCERQWVMWQKRDGSGDMAKANEVDSDGGEGGMGVLQPVHHGTLPCHLY